MVRFYVYEAGESDTDALQREIQEELGIKLISKSIKQKMIIEAEADGYASAQLEMKCFAADFEGELSIHSEIEDLAWISFYERSKCAPAAQLAIEYLYKAGALS